LANLLTHFSSSLVIASASFVAIGLGLFLAHAIEKHQAHRKQTR
jgi:hypothetical protein